LKDLSTGTAERSYLVKVGCGVDVKVEYVRHQNDDMAEIKEIRIIQTEKGNITFFVFSNSEQSLKLKNKSQVDIGTSHYPMSLTFWTSDWTVPHSVPMDQFVIGSQVPPHVSQASITQALPINISMSIQNIWLYPNDSLAVLELKTEAEAKNLMKRDISLDNHKTIIFHEAYLIHQSPNTLEDDTLSALRFTDNEDLRYSLRSLENMLLGCAMCTL
jgi:UDP-N-acetylglucosamine-lysosomal-enzyme